MRNNLEKSLKRYLKRKTKITLALIVSFLICGSVGYADALNQDATFEEFYDGEEYASLGANVIHLLGKKATINFKQGANLGTWSNRNNHASIHVSSDRYWTPSELTVNIGTSGDEAKSFILSALGTENAIRVKDKSKFILNGGNLLINRADMSNYHGTDSDQASFYVSGNSTFKGDVNSITILAPTTEDGSKKGATGITNSFSTLNINSKNDFLAEVSTGIYLYGSGTTSLISENGNIKIYAIYVKDEFLNENLYTGVGIYTNGLHTGNFNSKNSIEIIGKKSGLETFNRGNINLTSNFGKISIEGKSYGIIASAGGRNNLESNLVTIKGDTGLYSRGQHSSGQNSEITIKKNLNTIHNNEKAIVSGVLITSTSTGINSEDNGLVEISHDFLQVDSEKTGINSIGNGQVTINSNNTNILAKDDGIRTGNYGSVTINTTNNTKENKDNVVLISSDLRALTTATNTGDNGGNIDITSATINLLGNKVKDENIYTGTNNTNLKVQSVVFGYNGDINLDGNINIISENNIDLGDENRIYAGVQSRGGSTINLNGNTFISSKNGVALYATDLRDLNGDITTDSNRKQSTIDLSDVGEHKLFGDIVAGKNSTINIKGSGNYIGKDITKEATKDVEILSANGGTVNLDLTSGTLIGRVDDYYEAKVSDNGLDDNIFRNNKFYTDITSGGTINLKMNENTQWITKGQSFVSNINYDEDKNISVGDDFGTIDLSTEAGTSISIKNIGSDGTFKVKLNSDAAQGKDVDTDMIYIKNIIADNTVINVMAEDAIYLENGEKLRFATVGEKTDSNFNNSVIFKVNEVKERGIKNVSFSVEKEDYDVAKKDENNIYNGVTTETGKPGNEFIDKEYENGTNHYLTKNGDSNPGGDENVNDGGTTIIEIAKSNYANAVYLDNLNKRLGDMTFANGDEGIWVRMRNDRVGEDEHYRLDNFMTQIGYDKKYVMDNGDEHRGIAFEYGRGNLEYKELIGGETKADKYVLTLYDTRVRNNGVYTDYTLRAGALSNDFTTYGRETGAKVTGEFKNMLLGAGVEGGKRFDINENWYFEPQLQAQYTYVGGTDYTTNQGTKVDLDSIHSLIGRAGFRLGHDYYDENGKDNTIYVKADINREFLGDEKITAKDNTGSLNKTYHNDETWYDIGIGATKELSPDFTVYTDIEKQFGKHRDSDSWQFNLGFRYRFNSVKELNPVVMFRDFSLKADSYFDFDKSELKPEGKAVIKKVSEELNKENIEGTLKIEGHTDWTGTREYNQKLSERRAKSVEDELKKNITTDKIQYDTKGYGEDKPIADNTTKEGRAKNRRVDIKFEGTEEK